MDDKFIARQSLSHLTNKVLNWLNDIQALESQMDDLYKINLYLLRRYKDDLIKEFNIELPEIPNEWQVLLNVAFNTTTPPPDSDTLVLPIIMNKIKEQMNKEMPEPWYCYGIGNIPPIEN